MKKFYKESYFNKQNWLLEYFDKLNLNSDETLLVLLIMFCKDNKKVISYDFLTSKLNKNIKEVDKIITSLVNKHYLKLSSNSKGLVFDIDSIYEFDTSNYEVSENIDLYDKLGDIFGKPLTPSELQKVNDLLETYSEKKFLEAVRIAEANKKLKLSYIEGILRNEK